MNKYSDNNLVLREKKPKYRKILIILGVFIVFCGLAFFVSTRVRQAGSILSGFVFNRSIDLKKNQDSTINILFLGRGGGNHEGANLSDTIIFANINPNKNLINLISLPRDLWIPELGAKINSAYEKGNDTGKGIEYSKKIIGKVIGQNIDYVVVLDFSGFEKLINVIGGVDVEVKNVLDDSEYPIAGKEADPCGHTEEEIPLLATSSASLSESFPCRYQRLHFDVGVQHMDGETALSFARSRHAQGDEGTDFARSARQQQIISATKAKVLSLGTIFNPVKVYNIYNLLESNISTDIKTSELDDFIKLAQKMRLAKITSYVVDMGDEKTDRPGLLINPTIGPEFKNQWVLTPRVGNGNFSEIELFTKCIVELDNCKIEKNGIKEIK